jgi:hypothetical protein
MNPLARQLAELKFALQELESAVQQPQDERFAVEQILTYFPSVLTLFYRAICDALKTQGYEADSPQVAFSEAHCRGWLKGDMALWMRLIADYQQVTTANVSDAATSAMAQDVRACSWMLWETYELLTARFRWQTQVQPIAKAIAAVPAHRYAAPVM